jgi:hypothetical protein
MVINSAILMSVNRSLKPLIYRGGMVLGGASRPGMEKSEDCPPSPEADFTGIITSHYTNRVQDANHAASFAAGAIDMRQ